MNLLSYTELYNSSNRACSCGGRVLSGDRGGDGAGENPSMPFEGFIVGDCETVACRGSVNHRGSTGKMMSAAWQKSVTMSSQSRGSSHHLQSLRQSRLVPRRGGPPGELNE